MGIGRNGILEIVWRCSSGIKPNRKKSNVANNDDVMRGAAAVLMVALQITHLRTKCIPFHLKTRCVPRSKHSPSRL